MIIAGWILTGFIATFLFWDGGAKALGAEFAVSATTQLGFNEVQVKALGILLLVITALYLYPRTCVLGAVLITGYLGGAIAIHLALHNPLFSHTLFGVYVGVFMWAGIVLRAKSLFIIGIPH